MENQDHTESVEELAEWELIYQEEKGLSLAQRKSNQLVKLRQIVTSLHTIFGSALIAATKKSRGERMSDEELTLLQAVPEREELEKRVKGLIGGFRQEYYKTLETITGQSFSKAPEMPIIETQEPVEEDSTAEDESGRTFKVPKGFNKWDLKLIKLHESRPADGKRLWVEFFSLKGRQGLGEILYNPTKDLFYFKPYDHTHSSFAMTEEHGRKATQQARNYYFRVSPNPPVEEEKPPEIKQ